MEPRFVATLRPFRSAAVFNGESGRTSTAVPYGSERLAAKALTGVPAASANSSGASPMVPRSMARALSASASGAAAGNSLQRNS
jgi:hypothetical protein